MAPLTAAEPDRVPLIDGLLVANWSADVFRAMRQAEIVAANCTCCVWEDFQGTVDNIVRLRALIDQHDDLVRQVRTTAEIEAAERDGRSGIVLGLQNLSAIEGEVGYLGILHELGVRVAQLTYNTQNLVGSGCYESRDSGLSDFGHDVVAEMNELGMLVDLSHVGPRTTQDAITSSKLPVAFTHVAPLHLKQHPRNKTDEDMRLVAERGGIVGVTFLTWFLEAGPDSTLEHCVRAIEHVIDVAGEEHVGIGTDFTEGYGRDFLEWILRDQGYGRLLAAGPLEGIGLDMPRGLTRIADLPNLVQAMRDAGWSEERVHRVAAGNWKRLLGEVWGGSSASGSLVSAGVEGSR